MALESLYKDAVEQDVRLGLLRTTLQILQRHGQIPSQHACNHGSGSCDLRPAGNMCHLL